MEILYEIKDELNQKEFKIGTYKTNSTEIILEVKGTPTYYKSVKKDIENIVSKTVESTVLENYSIKIIKDRKNL